MPLRELPQLNASLANYRLRLWQSTTDVVYCSAKTVVSIPTDLVRHWAISLISAAYSPDVETITTLPQIHHQTTMPAIQSFLNGWHFLFKTRKT
jgi:hypothetical protein